MIHRGVLGAMAAAGIGLSGCASGYSQYYTPNPNVSDVTLRPGVQPQIRVSTGDQNADANAMFTEGYGVVGYASFNGPNEGVAGAISQAKKVGATAIVVSANYANTVSGAMPLTTPTTQTTYSSGQASAYGSGGFASGTYSGTSTTYGSQTTYIPYSVDRYDQQAIFFAELKPSRWGLRPRPVNTTEAQALGTQRAAYIEAVRRDSPAYRADILPGDFILKVDGQPFETSVSPTLGGRNCLGLRRGQRDLTLCMDVPAQ